MAGIGECRHLAAIHVHYKYLDNLIVSADNGDFAVGGVRIEGDCLGCFGGLYALGAAVAEGENQHYCAVAALEGGEVLDVGAREVVGGVVPYV